jgi:hypothetical protein
VEGVVGRDVRRQVDYATRSDQWAGGFHAPAQLGQAAGLHLTHAGVGNCHLQRSAGVERVAERGGVEGGHDVPPFRLARHKPFGQKPCDCVEDLSFRDLQLAGQ